MTTALHLGELHAYEQWLVAVIAFGPFVGGKIEGLIGDKLLSSLRAENRVGRTWLEGQA